MAIYRNVYAVMDPISIVGLLASLSSLSKALTRESKTLHSILKDSKSIENTIGKLYGESKDCSRP